MYEIIFQKKCPRLFVRSYQPNKMSDLIFQISAQAYSWNLIRPIFSLMLFARTVTVCDISELNATSINLGMINQVNMTIESRLAR